VPLLCEQCWVIGWALLGGEWPLGEHIMLVSGRAGLEIVQKSLVAGIPCLAAVSAPSSLAVELAESCGALLVGFLRDGGMNVYAGRLRLVE
jgi:FdhD protein